MITAQTRAYWTHDLDPFLIRFGENFGIRWYGLSYLMGFLVAFLLLRFYFDKKRSPLNPEQQTNFMTYIILGVLAGGRLGYMLLYSSGRESLAANPLNLFKVWEGGMASHGGFVGVVIAILLFARNNRIPASRLMDIIVSVGPAGLFFGRMANFINGELWGKVSQVPWAVIFPEAPGQPRHPSQLYEAGLEGLVMFLYVQHRFWRNRVAQDRPGHLAGEFLIGYSVARIFCEQFREPDDVLIAGVSKGQFYSIGLVAMGIVLIVLSRSKAARNEAAKSGD
ncbi:MAG: prolipoprotein diacylglyceryl transferase [Opitutae bacterium]|nr:prolipoprotein diacylglyceryl transferase [Opitutae bacterium]MBT5378604.1 prolipoprotein diacylglyceryl transferase [Opitutae bacterium]MBT5692649.1 prolipoprotein diacylglyceryl transferase [Opitutae bacterium]MBT6461761.1 prolipoprotein diacylglyceryl transferase [Opitutae bacterium]MBT6958080.1 prolipoprotein diacylglyceryl transferase [Opitutae bacterium]